MRLVTRLLCRNGNTALYFALALLPIVVLIGGGIDFQRSNNAKQQLQYVLDASVLAAARAGVEDYPTSAPLYFEGAASDITNFDPSASFSHRMQGADTVFTGTANATVPGLFTQMFGRDGISVAVESEAIRPGDASQPCIILLDQRENFALRVNSGADIQAETCEVHVHSTANWAANFNAGITLVFDRICIAGANVLDNDGTTENIELECTADPDPYSGRFPAPDTSSCDHTGLNMNGGSITLSPGV